ncbi:glycoside hydrolase family 5 protein [Mucilaginibacter dorajii]|uniref:Glycoside hydrolase family 5 domain-containing protein n=1 Tax=Mucilaginibacter dorajii TaxID=692994 RepID=A0ABP7Q4U7_9SPHI|nr:glycoside hydrolase family 5 protein [Mucilaginibacter dorajii]MCS3732660.1 endoglucanase [Mucilaginibacter dorajii]
MMRGVLPILFALIVFKASKAQNLTPVARNGVLKVQNGKLVNGQGIEPQLRGISFSWTLWQGQKYYNPGVVNWLANDFKVSIIRASMGVEPNGGYLQQPDKQQKLITDVVDAAIKDGIYVLIDWHDHHAENHMNESKDFFKQMTKKYAGVPNVIYEIYNEPAKANWKTVKEYALQVIPVIRKYDKNAVIVVGSPHWDQDVDIAATDPIIGYNNIVYSFHFYASDPNHQEALRAKANKAIKLGLPLMITEWGVGESNGDGEFNLSKTQTWVKWLIDNHLSWANWNITDKHETTAILQAGAPIYGGWTEANLTPAGLFIRELLRQPKPL